MYHAACQVEFQSFNRSYSQLMLFNIYKTYIFGKSFAMLAKFVETGLLVKITVFAYVPRFFLIIPERI